MTITEKQRRMLDLVADGLGWNWSDVEVMSEVMFGECVAGLTEYQATKLLDAMADEAYPRESRAMTDREQLVEQGGQTEMRVTMLPGVRVRDSDGNEGNVIRPEDACWDVNRFGRRRVVCADPLAGHVLVHMDRDINGVRDYWYLPETLEVVAHE